MRKLTIAIDGPAGAGKTTIAKALSKKLDILYLSTGALYRAFAVKFLDNDLNPDCEQTANQIASNTVIDVKYIQGAQHTFLDGVDVTERLSNAKVSEYSSKVSRFVAIRDALKNIQQKIAQEQSVIMDGRDIGSVVLPNANFKFYLDADVKVRAQRRFDELIKNGQIVKFENVLLDMKERDFNDTNRKISPLKKCKDSIVIDCTNLTIEQVVEQFEKHLKE